MTEIKNNIDYNQNNNNNDKEKKPIKRVIKTYRDFAVESLENKPTSLAKMIIMEKKKREQKEKVSIKNPKNTFLIILSSILTLLGVIAVASLILFINTKKNVDSEKNKVTITKSLINYDFKQYYPLSADNIKDAINDNVKNATIQAGAIKLLFFTKKDDLGYTKLSTAAEFLKSLDTRAPNQFIRNLDDSYAFGITSSIEEGNSPFLILETINFDASYSNMLA